jgi:hypothetical protein
MAMWRLYSNDGIAIRSTYRRLRDSLRDAPGEQMIGKVVYRDRRNPAQADFPGDTITPAFRKGMSFDFEHELRAFMLLDTRPDGQGESTIEEMERLQEKGVNIDVDLDELIEAVYVAPGRPTWFKELVERVVVKYGLRVPTVASALDERPGLT